MVTSGCHQPENLPQSSPSSEELAFDLQWQVGDVALVDNTLAMQARRCFRGTRKVVASSAEMQVQSFTPVV
jgi:alpha-ketoglutarate-dependent taurine dioxygenase